MNILHEAMTAEADLEEARRIEQVRRQGYDFIRVRYYGKIVPVVEQGTQRVINIRIKDVHDVIVYYEPDPETGASKPATRIGTSEVKFRQDRLTGDIIADILDDEYNRYFIARHHDFGIEAVDESVRRAIHFLIGKDYKVEASKAEMLIREKRRIEKELAAIGTDAIMEEDDEATVEKKQRRKARHAETAKLNKQRKEAEAAKPQQDTSNDDNML